MYECIENIEIDTYQHNNEIFPVNSLELFFTVMHECGKHK